MSTLTGDVAAPDAKCPGCGLDVGGCAIGEMPDGRTTWDRPARHDIGPTGTKFWSGGLTHVHGGERCLS